MSRERGAVGEKAARKALRRAGYRILEKNVRTPSGEIDIVALDGDVLCFVEVKARSGDAFGSPEEALDDVKRRRFRAAANEILRARRLTGRPHRLDLVAVELSASGDVTRVRVIPGVR